MKKKNIHILTNDNSFYIVNYDKLKHSQYFVSNCERIGSFKCPFLLQTISGINFSIALAYMNYLSTNIFESTINKSITFKEFQKTLDTLQIPKKLSNKFFQEHVTAIKKTDKSNDTELSKKCNNSSNKCTQSKKTINTEYDNAKCSNITK